MGTPSPPSATMPAADTLRLFFGGVTSALAFSRSVQSGHPALRAAADLEVRVCGASSTTVAHLCASPCTIALPLPTQSSTPTTSSSPTSSPTSSPAGYSRSQRSPVTGTLSFELLDPARSSVVAVAGAPATLFAASEGTVSVAFVCPDECSANGTLTFSFLRIGPALPRPTAGITPSPASVDRLVLVTAGLCASGVLSVGPATYMLSGMRLSRTVMPAAAADGLSSHPLAISAAAASASRPLALRLCAGADNALGGRGDVNALAVAAVQAVDEALVQVLATEDEAIAAVVAARAPDVPLVWLGVPRRARALGVRASLHSEGVSVMEAQCDGGNAEDEELLFVPPALFGDEKAGNPLPRRARSVTWADQVVTQPPLASVSSWPRARETHWHAGVTSNETAAQ